MPWLASSWQSRAFRIAERRRSSVVWPRIFRDDAAEGVAIEKNRRSGRSSAAATTISCRVVVLPAPDRPVIQKTRATGLWDRSVLAG